MDDVVRLETLCGGAVAERFQEAFQEAMENILDPNTAAAKKREITIKVSLEADNARELVQLKAEVNAKLASPAGTKTLVYLGRERDGRAVAREHNPRQGRLQLETPATPLPTVGPGFPAEE